MDLYELTIPVDYSDNDILDKEQETILLNDEFLVKNKN